MTFTHGNGTVAEKVPANRKKPRDLQDRAGR